MRHMPGFYHDLRSMLLNFAVRLETRNAFRVGGRHCMGEASLAPTGGTT